ncbi:MAG: glyoxalase superfamily protein [Gemmatimonadales bacterium]|nr:glyoxalase superfamily protein [Gemmatimonadales bacterium]
MHAAAPILRVADVRAALRYYIGALGFALDWDAGDMVSVGRGDCHLMLVQGDQGRPGSWVWIGVGDADALHDELLARGAFIRHPPQDYYWAREMQVADPDGNVLRCGSEPRPDAAPGAWLDMHGHRWRPTGVDGHVRSAEWFRPHLDHLVLGAPSLDEGVAHVERLTGMRARAGGRHPQWGTHNALIGLGVGAYLEIIAPDPSLPPPPGPRPFGLDALTAPRLVTWAARVPDLDARAERAAALGVPLGAPIEGRRVRDDGVPLAWRLTDPAVAPCDGLVPFLIDWGASPHPSASLTEASLDLVAFEASHPEEARAWDALEAVGLVLPIRRGPVTLRAKVVGPRGQVVLG